MELIVGTGEISVQEPDLGESSVVSTCLTAFIGQPLDRVAAFVVTLSDSTTATFGVDFIMPNFTSPILKIPADLAGSYVNCIETLIIGNDIAEGDKVIRMEVTPLFSVDSVAFSGSDEGSVVINILENDGMTIKIIVAVKGRKQTLFHFRSANLISYNYLRMLY